MSHRRRFAPPSLFRPLSSEEIEQLDAPPPQSWAVRRAPVILLRRCVVCKQYATEGSLARGRSNCCDAPLSEL